MSELSPPTLSANQTQTKSAFGYQWQMRDAFESPAVQEQTRRWLVDRYCNGDSGQIGRWLEGGRKRILDAGCGAGLSGMALFGDHVHDHDYVGVDIAPEALATARQRFAERGYDASFIEGNLSSLDLRDAHFDVILSEGVLHHTDDARAALGQLVRLLKPGGRLMFYVYAKKAVLREYTDDHVRDAISRLSEDEAWAALEPLTKLGKTLGELNVELEVQEDIPYLGIKKGSYDLQRFFYWNVCKLFYREDYTLDEMNHVNFDWYRPKNCSRHTREEVEGWCTAHGLRIERIVVEEAGITVVAVK